MIINRENGEIITPTRFPDGTSQVWKLKKTWTDYSVTSQPDLWWFYEHELEIMPFLQACRLISPTNVVIPYLPYARQDKSVGNENCFALQIFEQILFDYINKVYTFDMHGEAHGIFSNVSPIPLIEDIIARARVDLLVFPDSGAANRYKELCNKGIECVSFVKERDPLTGRITAYSMRGDTQIVGKNALVIDDILDGGATFIHTANALRDLKAGSVQVYASHGIFSKGISELVGAGIKRCYTTSSYRGSLDTSAGSRGFVHLTQIHPYIERAIKDAR